MMRGSRHDRSRVRRFRPYPEYRDSGVAWLDRLPTHWELKRLKTVASVELSNVDKKSEDGQIPVKLCNYVDVYYNDFITGEVEFMKATATGEQVCRFRLRVGDVLITKDSESWEDIAVPAVVSEELPDVVCGYHLAHIKPGSDLEGRFLARQFSAMGTRDQFHIAANGITRFGLGGDAIRTGLFPVPPLEEQRDIADVLDRETAKIDALVAKKERLIELLQEKRVALISRAVTRGLDANAPMKDSGIKWLGAIPAHWTVKRLRHLVRHIEQGWSPECENREADADEWGVLKAGCVNQGAFVESENKALPLRLKPLPSLEIKAGDVLMSRASGSRELVGSVAVVLECRPRLLLCDKVFRLHTNARRAHHHFIGYALNSRLVRWQIESVISGGGGLASNISQEAVKDLVVVEPPEKDQRVIANYLDRQTSNTDTLIAKVHEAITLLHEYRTALISAAVTGKIDVRAEAA